MPIDHSEDPDSLLTTEAIESAVLKEAFTHPAVLYPAALGIIGGLGGFLFGSAAGLLTAVGMFFVSSSAAVVNYYFRDKALAMRYIEKATKRRDQAREAEIQEIRATLLKYESLPGAASEVRQAVDQFDYATGKLSYLEKAPSNPDVDLELREGARFASEQVCRGILDNLRTVNAEFGKIADMRPDRLLEELKRIRNLARTRPGDIEDKAAYEQRLQLVKSRLESIARLVARNEEAITELERSTPMFLGTSHDGEFAEVGPETSLSRLKELAGKIHASQQLE